MCHLNNMPVGIGRVRREDASVPGDTLETIHISKDPTVTADQERKRNAEIYVSIIYLITKLNKLSEGTVYTKLALSGVFLNTSI